MAQPEIVVGDITTLEVDAIVNAANNRLDVIGRWLASGQVPTRIICCCFNEGDADVYRRELGVRSC